MFPAPDRENHLPGQEAPIDRQEAPSGATPVASIIRGGFRDGYFYGRVTALSGSDRADAGGSRKAGQSLEPVSSGCAAWGYSMNTPIVLVAEGDPDQTPSIVAAMLGQGYEVLEVSD